MAKITLKNIKAFLQGKIRLHFYYSQSLSWVIRKHISEQISMRIHSMERLCYTEGSCKLCGCETTALQMADKACDKPCYPKMLNKQEWKDINQKDYKLSVDGVLWTIEFDKFKML